MRGGIVWRLSSYFVIVKGVRENGVKRRREKFVLGNFLIFLCCSRGIKNMEWFNSILEKL